MSDNKLVKTIIDAALFGTVFFAVKGLIKLAHDQNKIIEKGISLLKDCEKKLLQYEEELSQCEKELSQCKKELSQCKKELSQCEENLSQCEKALST